MANTEEKVKTKKGNKDMDKMRARQDYLCSFVFLPVYLCVSICLNFCMVVSFCCFFRPVRLLSPLLIFLSMTSTVVQWAVVSQLPRDRLREAALLLIRRIRQEVRYTIYLLCISTHVYTLHLVFVFVLEPTRYKTLLISVFRRGFHVLFCIPKSLNGNKAPLKGSLRLSICLVPTPK
jgi:hypothetical protein